MWLTIMTTVSAIAVIIFPPSICPALQALNSHVPALCLDSKAHAKSERFRTWLHLVRKEGCCGPYGPGLAE